MDEGEIFFSKHFNTRSELIDDAKKFYASKGYALSIKYSRKDKYVVFGCDRGGSYRNRLNIPVEKRKKVSSSRLINCPFEIKGKKLEDGNWVIELRNNSHNHDPSSDMSGHPSARHLTKEEIDEIDKMCKAGIEPRDILSSLRDKNDNLAAVARTIYNLKAKLQKNSLGGRSLIQALFEEFEHGDFIFNYLKDESECLTHIFFTHPKSVILGRTYQSVFVMDCTYKTNKYGMPLLDIIGMSSFNKSFYAGFGFLLHEKQEDYVWALRMFSNAMGFDDSQPLVIVTDREFALINAIDEVFPRANHLLCVWHIQKNVVAKCKPYFTEQEDWDAFSSMWNSVIYAETEGEYNESWFLFTLVYKDKQEAITYLENTWIPHKEKFVSAWTEKSLHFGNRVSSRAEGAHAKLKRYLKVSNGNLRQVKNKICLAIENEFQEIKTQLQSEKLRIPHRYNISYFKNILNHVSMFALKKLHSQYEKASLGTANHVCTGNFLATMGLPCAHKMNFKKEECLQIHHIHPQWRIDTTSLTFRGSLDEANANETNVDDDEMKDMLAKLYQRYQQWPNFQRREVKRRIFTILNMEEPLVNEPNIQTRKKRKVKSKKGHGSSSTKRDLSQFENVEAAWMRKQQ